MLQLWDRLAKLSRSNRSNNLVKAGSLRYTSLFEKATERINFLLECYEVHYFIRKKDNILYNNILRTTGILRQKHGILHTYSNHR